LASNRRALFATGVTDFETSGSTVQGLGRHNYGGNGSGYVAFEFQGFGRELCSQQLVRLLVE
jgi:hypothetical protein